MKKLLVSLSAVFLVFGSVFESNAFAGFENAEGHSERTSEDIQEFREQFLATLKGQVANQLERSRPGRWWLTDLVDRVIEEKTEAEKAEALVAEKEEALASKVNQARRNVGEWTLGAIENISTPPRGSKFFARGAVKRGKRAAAQVIKWVSGVPGSSSASAK